MNYTQFIEEMCRRVAGKFDEKTIVESVKVEKNNGILLYGITIKTPDCNLAPTIYLEKFYQDYLDGADMESVLCDFMEVYDTKRIKEIPDFNFYNEYKKAKERFSVKLIHYEKNKSFLEKVPHKIYWDLAMIVYCQIAEITNAHATIIVTKEHIKKWNITEEELFYDAFRNAQAIMPCHVRTMAEVLKELTFCHRTEYDDETIKQMEKDSEEMLILTNQQNFFGAVCILYEDVLQNLADENKTDYYILPSSIHETILVPHRIAEHPEELKNMVMDVNRTQVDPEEILSDEIYFFDRLSGKILPV